MGVRPPLPAPLVTLAVPVTLLSCTLRVSDVSQAVGRPVVHVGHGSGGVDSGDAVTRAHALNGQLLRMSREIVGGSQHDLVARLPVHGAVQNQAGGASTN